LKNNLVKRNEIIKNEFLRKHLVNFYVWLFLKCNFYSIKEKSDAHDVNEPMENCVMIQDKHSFWILTSRQK
jgi:hypothetical protein